MVQNNTLRSKTSKKNPTTDRIVTGKERECTTRTDCEPYHSTPAPTPTNFSRKKTVSSHTVAVTAFKTSSRRTKAPGGPDSEP